MSTGAGIHFLSGQVALDANGDIVGEGDPVVQAEQAFANIESTLAGLGSSMADILHLRCFLTSADYYPAYAAAKAKHFPGAVPPGTVVIVTGLLDARFLLEVEATAVAREK
ncbi:MAG: yabJ 1 [Microbacteriaceae bacterium]|nr:yabJ 1 [Microbacteriaceae bacterium]